MPKMTHPNSTKTIEVAPDQTRLYASQGWVEKAAPQKTSARKTTTKAPAATTNKE